jgi:hypothetical protein
MQGLAMRALAPGVGVTNNRTCVSINKFAPTPVIQSNATEKLDFHRRYCVTQHIKLRIASEQHGLILDC